jgi:glucose-6-phosphate isomerase
MRNTPPQHADPAELTIVDGGMTGGSDRYEKHLWELVGLYQDESAFQTALKSDPGGPVYWVQSSKVEEGPGALTIGVSTLNPGRIGDEFAMTRGHIHKDHGSAELYFGLSGRGVMLMDTLEGETKAIEITPGVAVHVPGHWVHRSVNVGHVPFVTLFCYPSDAGQDYGVIADAGGMKKLVVVSEKTWGLRENPNHLPYHSKPREKGQQSSHE